MILNKSLGGVFLIAGTCIGAGMLGLPITSAAMGFHYSLLALLVCWAFMFYTGLLVLEVNLWLPEQPSYISMARLTLGRTGEVVCWIGFLFLFYSLLAAYIAGGGALLTTVVKEITQYELPVGAGPAVWMLVFGSVVFLGSKAIDGVNRLFMLGLITALALLLTIGMQRIDTQLLQAGNIQYAWTALPVLMASFGYHIVIPSIRHYLDGNVAKIKKTLWWGSLLTLTTYVLWEYLIFGIIPMQGDDGLIAVLNSGEAVTGLTQSLSHLTQNRWVELIAEFFAFFALSSSFLGVSFGLFDLLADGFTIKKDRRGRFIVTLITFVPPLIYALFYPKGFIVALGVAGVCVAIIHGIVPVLMVWRGRRQTRATVAYRAPGGVLFFVIAIAFFVLVIGADVAVNLR